MSYFKSKLRTISREYTKRDRNEVIRQAGDRCPMPMCKRKPGDIFIFGPTHYLKQQIRFKVKMDIHVVESSSTGRHLVVMCSGCHLSYHLFNRLSESADMGGRKLSDTTYKRCGQCKELNCMCCETCSRLPKWCNCSSEKPKKKRKKAGKKKAAKKTAKKTTKKRGKKCQKKVSEKKVKVRSRRSKSKKKAKKSRSGSRRSRT